MESISDRSTESDSDIYHFGNISRRCHSDYRFGNIYHSGNISRRCHSDHRFGHILIMRGNLRRLYHYLDSSSSVKISLKSIRAFLWEFTYQINFILHVILLHISVLYLVFYSNQSCLSFPCHVMV